MHLILRPLSSSTSTVFSTRLGEHWIILERIGEEDWKANSWGQYPTAFEISGLTEIEAKSLSIRFAVLHLGQHRATVPANAATWYKAVQRILLH
jgi:hypothetical protein